jgi:hypothetical protein
MDRTKDTSVITDDVMSETVMNSLIFENENDSAKQMGGKPMKPTMPTVNDSSALSDFLQRPVLIASRVWAINSNFAYDFDPWTAYLTHPSVVEKLQHYYRLSAALKVHLVFSGTPFHYGCLYVGNRPHPGHTITEDPQFNLATTTELSNYAESKKVVLSQLGGTCCNPGFDDSVDLYVPYVHYKPAIELGGAYNDISTVHMQSFSILRQANDGVEPIGIEIFASLVDPVVDVPTAVRQGFAMEEALKTGKKWLTKGLRATQLAEEWVPVAASVWAMLGLSRPLEQIEPTSVRQIPFNLAACDAPDSSGPLSVYRSQEVVLDGGSVGSTMEDELLFNSLAARDCYLSSSTWFPIDPSGEFLFGALVTPQLGVVSTFAKNAQALTLFGTVPAVTLAPVGMVSTALRYARFTMKYRVSVICSQYHKGRLRIWYDPNYAYGGSPGHNLVNAGVLNLAESRELEIEVPWQNVRDCVERPSPFESYVYNRAQGADEFAQRLAAASSNYFNGMIVVEVLTPLVAPTSSGEVTVLFSARASEITGHSPQLPPVAASDLGAAPYVVAQSFDVSGGDSIASFRTLLKRYCLEYTVQHRSGSAGGQGQVLELLLPMYLPMPGFDPEGLDVNSASLIRANYTAMSFRMFVSSAFALIRGAIRAKVEVATVNAATIGSGRSYVARTTCNANEFGGVEWRRQRTRVANGTAFNTECAAAREGRLLMNAAEGQQDANVSGRHTSFLDVQLPYTSNYRARASRTRSTGLHKDGSDRQNMVLSTEVSSSTNTSYALYRIYCAGAEDYTTMCFIHAPVLLAALPYDNT